MLRVDTILCRIKHAIMPVANKIVTLRLRYIHRPLSPPVSPPAFQLVSPHPRTNTPPSRNPHLPDIYISSLHRSPLSFGTDCCLRLHHVTLSSSARVVRNQLVLLAVSTITRGAALPQTPLLALIRRESNVLGFVVTAVIDSDSNSHWW